MTYTLSSPTIGVPGITTVASDTLGGPGNNALTGLPSVTFEAQLGQVVDAWDAANNWAGKFIFLKVPVSTTITVGLLYQWDKNYQTTLVPVVSTSKNTGVAVAVAYTAVTSNATLVQYAWFLIQGTVATLKTAVTVPPQSNIYISATAGRVKILTSAGAGIIGARSNNATTVTSTTSTVNVYYNFSAIELNTSGG